MNGPTRDSKLSPRFIYTQALALEDQELRQRLIDELCAGDADLKARVQKLLDSRTQAAHGLLARAVGSWDLCHLETAPESPDVSTFVDADKTKPSQEHCPAAISSIGPYQLLEVLGEGGMGTVYHARQTYPIEREVALKIIKADRNTPEAVARFARERQALALMEHPNIAKIFDGGEAEDGSQFFVMELLRGMPITDYCRSRCLTIEQRLRLMIDLGKAIEHAHSKGVVHRDLKPSNILVAEVDGTPVLKVIDFGIAKSFGGPSKEELEHTRVDQILGTPLYQAPEQICAPDFEIDARVDVYAMGVVLYEVLTGTTPLDRNTLGQTGYNGFMQLLREQDFDAPSGRVTDLSTRASESSTGAMPPLWQATGRLAKGRQRELDWISLRALEHSVERRYASAKLFTEELQRFLNHEPIAAGPPSSLVRIRKWGRRHRVQLLVASSVLLALLGLATSVQQYFSSGSPNLSRASTAKTQAWKQTAQLQRALVAFQSSDFARLYDITVDMPTRSTMPKNGDILGGPEPQGADFDLMEMLRSAAKPEPMLTLESSSDFQAVDYAPQAKRLIVATKQGEIRMFDWSQSGQNTQTPIVIGTQPGRVDAIAISPDGKRAVSGTDCLWFWDLEERRLDHEGVFLDAGIETIEWSNDGKTVAAGSRYETVWVGDREGQELFRVINDHRHESLLFTADSQRLLIPTRLGIDEYDLANGERLRTLDVLPLENVRAMCFAGPNQQWLIAADRFEEDALVLDLNSGDLIGHIPLNGRYPQSLRVANEGKWLTVFYPDGKCSIVRISQLVDNQVTGELIFQFPAFPPKPLPDDSRIDLIWMDKSERFLTLGGNQPARLWDWDDIVATQLRNPPMKLWAAFPGFEDHLIFVPNDKREIGNRTYPVGLKTETHQPLGDRIDAPTGYFSNLSSNQLVVSWGQTTLDVIDLQSGKVLAQIDVPKFAGDRMPSLSRDGSTLATAGPNQVWVWRTEDGWNSWKLEHDLKIDTLPLIALSADGRELLVNHGSKLQELDLDLGKVIRIYDDQLPSTVWEVALDREERRVATGKRSNITVFSRDDGEPLHAFECESEVTCLKFTNDDEILLSGHRDGSIRAWHLTTNQALGNLFRPKHQIGQIRRIDYFPGRNRILATAAMRDNLSPIILGN